MTHANPFHVLGLPTDADNETIVRTGEDLSTTAETETERERYAWAVRELLGDAMSARVHRLLEAPGAAYRDDQWADFTRRHKRPPVDTASFGRDPVTARDLRPAEAVGLVLDELIVPPDVDVAEAVLHAPHDPVQGPSPLGVADVLFG